MPFTIEPGSTQIYGFDEVFDHPDVFLTVKGKKVLVSIGQDRIGSDLASIQVDG
jgi:hypothetical protein